jgi:ferredoxin--NADP+ reductase
VKVYKIAIVGSGPAGFFTAQAFQNSETDGINFTIDMIERLPTPWGLVRSGVAPDHPKIKTVSKVFEKISKKEGFRLFANVELGKDISLKDLREAYDVVVLATGSTDGKKLSIRGEDLRNCISAANLVPWYNAHPDYSDLKIDLNSETAVVIGLGNVALDVARILAIDPAELETTDIAEHALSVLKASKIRKVIICGRRGPEHATFTLPELRGLFDLKNTDVYIDINQLNEAQTRIYQTGNIEKELKNNLDVLFSIAKKARKGTDRAIEIKFLSTPVQINGNGHVEEVVFAVSKVKDGKVFVSDNQFSIKTGVVISAIGYESILFPEIKVENGRIKNIAGHVEHNIYVTGWAKRGPVGVIGTNKSDSADVVELIIDNLKEPKKCQGIEGLLRPGYQLIDQIGWEKINASELISGELVGKPRKKIANWEELISKGTSI